MTIYNHNELLVKAYTGTGSLYPRRTLDQYHYYMLKDTEERDRDQVVERWFEKHPENFKGREQHGPNILMVDQLWLWIVRGKKGSPVAKDTVITSFPKRQGEDGDVFKSILNYLKDDKRSAITNVEELVSLIVRQCTNVFDRSRAPLELRFQEFFEGQIGEAVRLFRRPDPGEF